MIKEFNELRNLVQDPDCFGELSYAEYQLINAVTEGGIAQSHHPQIPMAQQVTAERTVRGSLIRWLMMDPSAVRLNASRQIAIADAVIDDELNLEGIGSDFGLVLIGCQINSKVDLKEARLRSLTLTGTHCAAIYGDSIIVNGSIALDHGFQASGQVFFNNASIAGDLDMTGAALTYATDGPSPYQHIVLYVCDAHIAGNVQLNSGFRAMGPIVFVNSYVGGDIRCTDGHFAAFRWGQPRMDDAIVLNQTKVVGTVDLSGGFEAYGGVEARNVTIGGDLRCEGGFFDQGLVFPRSSITGDVNLNFSHVRGIVDLGRTSIGGSLKCREARFFNPDRQVENAAFNPQVFYAEHIDVKGDVYLYGLKTVGETVFRFATIRGNFDCRRGKLLSHPGISALNLNNSSISGSVFLNEGFGAKGLVKLLGTTIGGDLDCSAGYFKRGRRVDKDDKKNSFSLYADHAVVHGDILMGEQIIDGKKFSFRTNGEVQLNHVKTDGDLVMDTAEFLGNLDDGLHLQTTSISGQFSWRKIKPGPKTKLNMYHTSVGRLEWDIESWPKDGYLILDGFVYGAFQEYFGDDPQGTTLGNLLTWLSRQPKDRISLQPYEQLARVLRQAGRESMAQEVQIQKRREIRKRSRNWLSNALDWILDVTIRYGYRPSRVILPSLGFVIAGMIIFWFAFPSEIVLTKPNEQTPVWFNAFIYSLDTFLPIISLHQKEYFIPRGNWSWGGTFVAAYYWLHILAGWVLVTLGVAGITGIVKKD